VVCCVVPIEPPQLPKTLSLAGTYDGEALVFSTLASKTLERAHCRSQVLGVDDVLPLEHPARAVSAHPHDDRLRDADSAPPGDEAPPEIVERR
jgi:hypothetical protein